MCLGANDQEDGERFQNCGCDVKFTLISLYHHVCDPIKERESSTYKGPSELIAVWSFPWRSLPASAGILPMSNVVWMRGKRSGLNVIFMVVNATGATST
jgi:hypothetical protein